MNDAQDLLSFLPQVDLRSCWQFGGAVFSWWYVPLGIMGSAAVARFRHKIAAAPAILAALATTALCWGLVIRVPLALFATIIAVHHAPWPGGRPNEAQPAVWLAALVISSVVAGLLQAGVYRLFLNKRLSGAAFGLLCLIQLLCLGVAANRMAAWFLAHPPEA